MWGRGKSKSNGKEKSGWRRLKLAISTGASMRRDWRAKTKPPMRRSPTAAAAAAAQTANARATPGTARVTKEQHQKDIDFGRKQQRFNKLATRRSSFLSTNLNVRKTAAERGAREDAERAAAKLRQQRRRSQATGEIMAAAASAVRARPESAPAVRDLLFSVVNTPKFQDDTLAAAAVSEATVAAAAPAAEPTMVKHDRRLLETLDAEAKAKIAQIEGVDERQAAEQKALAVLKRRETLSQRQRRLLLAKPVKMVPELVRNLRRERGPGQGLYRAPRMLRGRETMSQHADGRNRGKLPKAFTHGALSCLWVSGAAERRHPVRGFRLMTGSLAELSSEGTSIVDVGVMGNSRFVTIVRRRGMCKASINDPTAETNVVYFLQGEASAMKGHALCKAGAVPVAGLPADCEHVACTTTRSYVLSRRGDVFSVAPKPNEDPRFVWEKPVEENRREAFVYEDEEGADAALTYERDADPIRAARGSANFFVRPMMSLSRKRVVGLSCGATHACAVNAAGLLWTWGQGLALGHGTNVVDVIAPRMLSEVYHDRGLRVMTVSAGSHHTLAITVRMRPLVSSLEDNTDQEEGDRESDEENGDETVGEHADDNEARASTAVHPVHTEDDKIGGVVYLSFGAWDARLGMKRIPTTVTEPVCWAPAVMNLMPYSSAQDASRLLVRFRMLVAGGSHSLALEGDPSGPHGGTLNGRGLGTLGGGVRATGSVWAFGNNSYGQLGLGHTATVWTPKKLRYPQGVLDLACGERHSICVTLKGEVWAWGDNLEGQSGHPDDISVRLVPRAVSGGISGVAVRSVRVGGRVSVVLTEPLQRDVRGRWISVDAALQRRKVEEANTNLPPVVKRMARGWNRVKTFAKATEKAEREALAEQKREAVARREAEGQQRRQTRELERRRRRRAGFADSDSSDDDETAMAEWLAERRRLLQIGDQVDRSEELPPTTFMAPPRLMLANADEIPLPDRAPAWLHLATEWLRERTAADGHIAAMNVGDGSKVPLYSDRDVWTGGHVMGSNYLRYETAQTQRIFGRRTRLPEADAMHVRDALFQLRRYTKKLVLAQAAARGAVTRERLRRTPRHKWSRRRKRRKKTTAADVRRSQAMF